MRANIIGVGMAPFGRHDQTAVEDLAGRACLAALDDSGLELRQIQAAYCGHVSQGMTLGERVLDRIGIAGIPVANFENACASSSTALHFACLSVAAGQYDVVLVIGAEKMQPGLLPLADMMESDLEALVGQTVPSLSAMYANRYREDHELQPEDLAAVAVKNSTNAARNPHAHHRRKLSVEEILSAPMISAPLTRLMCCPTSDGAAAVIVCNDKIARRYSGRCVQIADIHIEGGHVIGTKDLPNATARAARAAYDRAGIDPDDVDLVEGLDYTSMAEILLYEDLGFCGRGEGVGMIRDGETALDGRVAFSPGGGLLGRGHPLGATGVAQVVEAVCQLRGEAGDRQVRDAKVALTHAAGGVLTGVDDEGVVTIGLLTR